MNMIKNLAENQENSNSIIDENILENGLIGSLAKELAEDINLEDLIINQEEETRNLLEYCELDWDKNCLTWNSSKGASETLSSEKLPEMMYEFDSATWKNYEPHIKPLLTGLESI